MSEIEVIKDLSNKKLCTVPEDVYYLPNLKMLYLENNLIEELPDELFVCLDKLSWLDMRNNKLVAIPKSIEFHANLETLLLQNNYIQELPTELGLIPKLKVLQICDNPLRYPKKSIIEKGVLGIVQFLKHEHIHKGPQHDNDNISEDNSDGEEQHFTNGRGHLIHQKYAVKMPVTKLKSLHRLSDRNIRHKLSKNKIRVQKKTSNKQLRPSNTSKYQDMYSTKRDEYKIEEEHVKELWMKKLREVMVKQEELLQRERDFEALKTWRRNPKHREQERDLDYRPQVPYDYDAEYDRMPTRFEYQYPHRERSRYGHSQTAKLSKNSDVEKMIADICSSLHNMDLEHSVPQTPKSQMDFYGRDIKRILDLQKQLSALRITNDTCI